jgi:hypothetical protein
MLPPVFAAIAILMGSAMSVLVARSMKHSVVLCWVCIIFSLAHSISRAEDSTVPAISENGKLTVDIKPAAECLSPAPASAPPEFGWELDPYYSNVSLTIPLTNSSVPEVTDKNEFAIYRQLLRNSLFPRFMLFEAAVFPMPFLGVGAKKYTPEFYEDFSIGKDGLNLVEAVTAGFQEPYAFSIFFGNMVDFVKPGEKKSCANRGYMGYLFSYSNQHIKRNVLVPDNSLESEWKFKGDRVFKEDKLSWSFRIGSKIHDNPDISDSVYLGFRRSNLDFSAAILSFLDNSSIDFRWDFSVKDGRPLRQEYTIGKTIPIPRWHVAMKLDVGFIWEDPANYRGKLHDTNYQSVVAVIRPNIEF